MGKNKRKHPDIEEILARPWCYYCERDFDDLKILINHQKAKHFKCERCGRRLNTAGGLSVHMTQVHKETLTIIENALPNRSGLDVEIFGMEGIPEEIVQTHNQRVLQSFAQAEAERRAATGNTGQDNASGGAPKKPKFEAPSDLKKRLAEHKAKKAAEEAAGISSGNNTPGRVVDNAQSPSGFAGAASPNFTQQQNPFGPPSNNAPFSPYNAPPYQQPPAGQQQPPFQQASHHSQAPFPQQPQQSPHIQQQQTAFSPPGMPQYPNNAPFLQPQPFQPPGGHGFPAQYHNAPSPHYQGPPQFQNGPPPHFQNGPPHFQNGPPQYQNGPPHFNNGPPQMMHVGPPQTYGAGSPPPFLPGQVPPPHSGTSPHVNTMPQRPPSLPPAPGLPQRPAFGAPPVNAQEMQQMHQGQLRGPTGAQPPAAQNGLEAPPSIKTQVANLQLESPAAPSANATSLDDLVSGAAHDADNSANAAGGKMSEPKPTGTKEAQEEKKSKKSKDNQKLIYSDNEISPEEKMAHLARYAFVPNT